LLRFSPSLLEPTPFVRHVGGTFRFFSHHSGRVGLGCRFKLVSLPLFIFYLPLFSHFICWFPHPMNMGLPLFPDSPGRSSLSLWWTTPAKFPSPLREGSVGSSYVFLTRTACVKCGCGDPSFPFAAGFSYFLVCGLDF